MAKMPFDLWDAKYFAKQALGKGKGIASKAGLIGLGVGAAVALPVVAAETRHNRTYAKLGPKADELNTPLQPTIQPEVPEIAAAPQTMMGMSPIEGPMAAKIKMQRAGLSAGIDSTSPSIIDPSGRNMIDGSMGMQSLGRG